MDDLGMLPRFARYVGKRRAGYDVDENQQDFLRAMEEQARLKEQLAYSTIFNPDRPKEGASEVQMFGGQAPRTLGGRWDAEARLNLLSALLAHQGMQPGR